MCCNCQRDCMDMYRRVLCLYREWVGVCVCVCACLCLCVLPIISIISEIGALCVQNGNKRAKGQQQSGAQRAFHVFRRSSELFLSLPLYCAMMAKVFAYDNAKWSGRVAQAGQVGKRVDGWKVEREGRSEGAIKGIYCRCRSVALSLPLSLPLAHSAGERTASCGQKRMNAQ